MILLRRDKVKSKGYNREITSKQKKMAEMLVNPEFEGNITELCEICGVARSTFYKWMRNEEFTKYLDEQIDLYTNSELSAIWKSLIKKCKQGDVAAIKLYFELKDKYKMNIETYEVRIVDDI